MTDEKGKSETRTVLRFHPRIAPVKAGIFPLLKNNEQLVAKAREITALLRPHMMTFYDEGGAIGRRYRRQDEIGTPFGITVDFETLGEKGGRAQRHRHPPPSRQHEAGARRHQRPARVLHFGADRMKGSRVCHAPLGLGTVRPRQQPRAPLRSTLGWLMPGLWPYLTRLRASTASGLLNSLYPCPSAFIRGSIPRQ